MKHLRNHSGFSIIEMVLSMLMVVSLSAVSYKVLKNQTSQQLVTMDNQKNNRTLQVALSRFKTDADMIDPNWVRYGITTVWPEQGYGFGQNYYLLTKQQQNKISVVNDGVTFLRRNPQSDRLYVPYTSKKRLCEPTPIIGAEDQNLYGVNIPLDSITNLNVGDWMLVYQAGHYALGVISTITPTANPAPPGSQEMSKRYITGGSGSDSSVVASPGSVQFRKPNATERQTTSNNSSGFSNGFVTKSGVIPASFDMQGTATQTADDNAFCFDISKVSIQKIAFPVSYFADFRTSDGKGKGANNTYALDTKQGNQIKMLVRAEYVGGVRKREYIAPIDEVGFTYDLINPDAADNENRIARNVGRVKGSNFLSNLGAFNPAQAAGNILNSYRIVSLKMSLGATVKDPQRPAEEWKQMREVKIALDPSVQQDAYQEETKLLSSLTDNLNTLPKISNGVVNEQIGKPVYLATSGQNEVVVPASTFEIMNDGTLGSESKGALYVYNTEGCAVNSGTGSCSPNSQSAIQFNIGNGTTFFPNSISQVELPDGNRRVIVGGVAMGNSNGSTFRKPGLGIITLAPNESLKDKLANNSGADGCNIANCKWDRIMQSSDTADLMDTAHIAVDPVATNSIYVAPMTKSTGKDSQSSIYKGVWTNGSYSFTKFAGIVGTEEGKIVTAISDRPIRIQNQNYIAVCLSKNMSSTCNGDCLKPLQEEDGGSGKIIQDDGGREGSGDSGGGKDKQGGSVTIRSEAEMYGEIQLVNQGNGTSLPGFVLKRHNYRCSSINVDDNQNLIVAGRLTAQPISYQYIKEVVNKGDRRPATAIAANSTYEQVAHANAQASNVPMMYLDEVVSESHGKTYYADYYQVDPNTYENPSNPQYIGWLTGMSTVEFPDGTFGMVNANKYRLASNFGINGEATPKEYSNAGISKVRLAGMTDRVVATIQTDPANINNSIITAVYSARANELPSVYIKGKFMVQAGRRRLNPTPLPSLSPSLNEKSWLQLYQSLLTPSSESGLNSNMPILGSDYAPVANCQSTKPKTCD